MIQKAEATITPRVLRWARERLGLSLSEAARQISVKEETLLAWENHEKYPTPTKLYVLAEKYGQPAGVFYLPEPPPDEPLPHDFRFLPETADQGVNPALVKEIRRAQRIRDEALELSEDLGLRQPSFEVRTHLGDEPENVAKKIRNVLGIELDEQSKWREVGLARKKWTEATERIGILVLYTERISMREFRGVSLGGDGLPVILLNGQDSDAGRVFTLMHEIAHLALHNAGICNPFEVPSKAKTINTGTELFCNRVAAAILMPKSSLLENLQVKNATRQSEWPDDYLEPLARQYSVSREAILVRLLELGKTNQDYYDTRRHDFKREYELYQQRKKQTKVNIPYKYRILNRNGRAYVKLVLSALYENIITTADVASLTGVNLKHMGSVEKELFGRPIIFGHGA